MVSLVTGAGGLLGHSLANILAQNNKSVRALIRKASDKDLFDLNNIETMIGDLTDQDSLRAAVKGVDVVYHCAATSTDWADWDTYYGGNVDGVKNLLDAVIAESKAIRFVHVSSTDVYGFPVRVVSEEAPMVDVGLPYNKTKIIGENLVQQAYKEHGLPITIIRPGTIYGPRSADFIVEIHEQLKVGMMPLISGGCSSPGLIFVDNVSNAMILAAKSDKTVGKAYNLRDESVQSWKEYTHALAKAFQLPPPRLRLPFTFAFPFAWSMEKLHSVLKLKTKPLLTRHAVYLLSRDASFPIDRAKQDFGFKSEVSFESGIDKSVRWFREVYEPQKDRKSARGW